MTMGRPREHNREKIAEDLIIWAKLPDSINLCKFCAYYEPPISPSKITNWAKEDDNFRQAYEITKMYLGARREEMLNAELLHVKAYDLNAKTYDHFLKEEWKENLAYEVSQKKESEGKQDKTVIVNVHSDGLASGSKVSSKTISTTNN